MEFRKFSSLRKKKIAKCGNNFFVEGNKRMKGEEDSSTKCGNKQQ